MLLEIVYLGQEERKTFSAFASCTYMECSKKHKVNLRHNRDSDEVCESHLAVEVLHHVQEEFSGLQYCN